MHVASICPCMGTAHLPQDRARIARDRMKKVFIYNLLTYSTGIIYIIAVDLGVFLVSVLLWSSKVSVLHFSLSSLSSRGTFPLSLPVKETVFLPVSVAPLA